MVMTSMTGQAMQESKEHGLNCLCEIKSLNHRFKDARIKISPIISYLETSIRNELNKTFSRGFFEININLSSNVEHKDPFLLDMPKIKNFVESFEKAFSKNKHIHIQLNPMEFLSQDFFSHSINSSLDQDDISHFVIDTFKKTCEKLLFVRREEGKNIQNIIENAVNELRKEHHAIEELTLHQKPAVVQKLTSRWNEVQQSSPSLKIDENRFLQEVIYYLEKYDINEELDRIKMHLNKIDSIFNQNIDIGKTMEFTIQELHREVNTLGQKTLFLKISHIVVNMKVIIEKMREQILNIE